MKKPSKPPEIRHRGSLMTWPDHGQERCFGYLFEFPGHGIFEPNFGKLEVTSEEAKTHNRLLSQGEIEGLDNHCAVGMGGLFYTRKVDGQTRVMTWLGEEVSQNVQVHGNVITFQRKGMGFRGRLRQQEDAFAFRRIPLPAQPGGKAP
jgi:hypothetical protein